MDYTDGEKIAAATLAATHFQVSPSSDNTLDVLYPRYLNLVREHQTPPAKKPQPK